MCRLGVTGKKNSHVKQGEEELSSQIFKCKDNCRLDISEFTDLKEVLIHMIWKYIWHYKCFHKWPSILWFSKASNYASVTLKPKEKSFNWGAYLKTNRTGSWKYYFRHLSTANYFFQTFHVYLQSSLSLIFHSLQFNLKLQTAMLAY